MGLKTTVEVRQPADNELVGRRFTVAGIGAGFEGTIGLRLLNKKGDRIARGFAQSEGGMAGVGEFTTQLSVASPPKPGSILTLQAFGDNPGLPDEGPRPGFDLFEIQVIMFGDLAGWLLYKVERGDTLTGIAAELSDFGETSVEEIVAANPHLISDPDHIETGWLLRVPQHR